MIIGAVAEAWSLIRAELANVEPDHASTDAARLLVRGGTVAWFRGDHEQAATYIERGLAAARRAGDGADEWYARHTLAHVGYAIDGDRQAAADAFSEHVAFARVRASKIGEATTLIDVACHNGGALPDVESGIRAAEQAGSPAALA